MFDPNSTTNVGLVSEGVIPDDLLDELAKEPAAGVWPVGWYKATIVEGYASRKGNQFTTSNFLSKAGTSWNFRLCLAVTDAKGELRNIQGSFNYRTEDFTPERMAAIKDAREEFKGVKEWPGTAKDLQRSSLAIASIGQLKKAVGFSIRTLDNGTIDPTPFFNQAVDVRLGHRTQENGQVFNEPTDFAPAGTKVGKSK